MGVSYINTGFITLSGNLQGVTNKVILAKMSSNSMGWIFERQTSHWINSLAEYNLSVLKVVKFTLQIFNHVQGKYKKDGIFQSFTKPWGNFPCIVQLHLQVTVHAFSKSTPVYIL